MERKRDAGFPATDETAYRCRRQHTFRLVVNSLAKKEKKEYQPAREIPSEKQAHGKGKVVLLVCGCTAAVLVAAAAAGGAYLLHDGGAFDETRFYKNTYLNGIDCGGMTVEEAYNAITVDQGEYVLRIVERGGEETITGREISLAERPDTAAIQAVLDRQNDGKLFLIRQYFAAEDSSIGLVRSYDQAQADACIDALACLDAGQMIAPVDSQLLKGETDYYITESVAGTTLDAETARGLIAAALENGEETVDLEGAGVYSSPAITEDDPSLNAQLAQIQSFTKAAITYDFADRTYVCDGSVIMNWLVQDEAGNWDLDEDQVYAWVDQMGNETDTYGEPHTFVTHNGDTLTLPNGNFGWKLYRDTTTAELVEMIRAGEVVTTEPNYYHYGVSRTVNDIGSTYVEVDITHQKVYLYVNGNCILETDCVTGTANNSERATPSNGVWAISYKKSPATLGTLETNGYESPVTYWMPFNGNVGLHDADGWRSSYGGSIYKYNGSHGCVNLPLSAAKTIYENIQPGYPVVVYGS